VMASLKAFGVGSLIWARERCREWNWNANAAEIARELIDAGIKPDTDDMNNVRRAFLDYFSKPGNNEAKLQWEFISHAVAEFGDD